MSTLRFDARYVEHIKVPRLHLFLSVDLENSTQLKQANRAGHNKNWLPVILKFIEEFPHDFTVQLEKASKEASQPTCTPALWKVLGDEIVFNFEVTKGDDLCCVVSAFRATIEHFNEQTNLARKASVSQDHQRLLVKGSAWIAGFPVTNSIIPLHKGNEYDYVGPSMDLGFRLGKLATPQRLVISADLAWLLSVCLVRNPMIFHFEGRARLQGVSEKFGYPLIWLEVGDSKYQHYEDASLGKRPLKNADLKNLCENFILEHGVPGFLPFIPSEPARTPPPADFDKEIALILDSFKVEEMLAVPDIATTASAMDDYEQKMKIIIDKLGQQLAQEDEGMSDEDLWQD